MRPPSTQTSPSSIEPTPDNTTATSITTTSTSTPTSRLSHHPATTNLDLGPLPHASTSHSPHTPPTKLPLSALPLESQRILHRDPSSSFISSASRPPPAEPKPSEKAKGKGKIKGKEKASENDLMEPAISNSGASIDEGGETAPRGKVNKKAKPTEEWIKSVDYSYQYVPVIQQHRGRKKIAYELVMRQQPMQARMCGIGEKADRRPIDPTPIIQLKVTSDGEDVTPHNPRHKRIKGIRRPTMSSNSMLFMQNPFYFLFACLVGGDNQDSELHVIDDGRTRLLTGTPVSSLYHLKDVDDKDAAFFVFPDLGVRKEGRYRLKLTLFEIVDSEVYYCTTVCTATFSVYSAKKFPGMSKATDLSRMLAEQGMKIRVRKDPRRKASERESTELSSVAARKLDPEFKRKSGALSEDAAPLLPKRPRGMVTHPNRGVYGSEVPFANYPPLPGGYYTAYNDMPPPPPPSFDGYRILTGAPQIQHPPRIIHQRPQPVQQGHPQPQQYHAMDHYGYMNSPHSMPPTVAHPEQYSHFSPGSHYPQVPPPNPGYDVRGRVEIRGHPDAGRERNGRDLRDLRRRNEHDLHEMRQPDMRDTRVLHGPREVWDSRDPRDRAVLLPPDHALPIRNISHQQISPPLPPPPRSAGATLVSHATLPLPVKQNRPSTAPRDHVHSNPPSSIRLPPLSTRIDGPPPLLSRIDGPPSLDLFSRDSRGESRGLRELFDPRGDHYHDSRPESSWSDTRRTRNDHTSLRSPVISGVPRTSDRIGLGNLVD